MRWLLAFFLFFPSVVLANSVDNFTWASSDAVHVFEWQLPTSISCCSFSFGDYSGTFDVNDVYFSCTALDCVDAMTEYYEHFSQPIGVLGGNSLTFTPGTYQDVFGFTDNWGATMTIIDPPAATSEPSTIVMLIAAFFVVVISGWKRFMDRIQPVENEHGWRNNKIGGDAT